MHSFFFGGDFLKLAVLIIEDCLFSADLDIREIKKAGFEVDYRIVSSCQSMTLALKERKWDMIISDNSMQNFNATMALEVRNNINCIIPFIIVTENIDEEEIYKAVKNGCNAFLPKERLQELRKLVKSLFK